MQTRTGDARALEVEAGHQVALGLTAIDGRETVGQRFERNFVGAEIDGVLVAGHAEIQIHLRVDRRPVEGELNRLQRHVAAFDPRSRRQVRQFEFAQVTAPHVGLQREELDGQRHCRRLSLAASRRRRG